MLTKKETGQRLSFGVPAMHLKRISIRTFPTDETILNGLYKASSHG